MIRMVGAESIGETLENPENVTKNLDELLEHNAQLYSEYMDIDISKEKADFSENVDELLMRLDEFCGLVDLIRSDTNLCLGKTLPAIHAKSQQMHAIFKRIDQLEEFVGMVKSTVATMEGRMAQAEVDLATASPLQKILNVSVPFFSKKTAPRSPAPKFEAPEIFRTEDYLHYPDLDTHSKDNASTSHTGTKPSS